MGKEIHGKLYRHQFKKFGSGTTATGGLGRFGKFGEPKKAQMGGKNFLPQKSPIAIF